MTTSYAFTDNLFKNNCLYHYDVVSACHAALEYVRNKYPDPVGVDSFVCDGNSTL